MKLTDTQSLLLAHAAQCDSGSLYPLPKTLTSKAGAARSIVSLVKARLVEERETSVVAEVARQDGDLGYGMFVTADGLAAIGVDDNAGEQVAGGSDAEALPTPAPRTCKIAGVLALLGRDEGATLTELITATGWLPHTTRAALTGLRKKGHVLARSKREGATCYRLVQA
ncbi:DUF3489 domain-containing protein [Sphingomonas citricola]|uniref:DUF3489 domain-containing protein n=1 Tax=Sphingomonas citricola TaxID=2862498 RepID=UPI002155FCF7|nr:DUF3489 domain-containing protein [Sphingomonas citricola]